MSGYLSFVRTERRFLAFGVVVALSSSFGQTFFVSLFAKQLKAAFELSNSDYGGLYSLATLCSAACLTWAGRKLDLVDLRVFAAVIAVALAAACFGMALVPTAAVLGVVFFGLRLFGQGLMSHTAMTSMARYYEGRRATAMSVASMGFAIGEGVLPLVVLSALGGLDWRTLWGINGVVLLALQVPLVAWLLRGHGERHAAFEARTTSESVSPQPVGGKPERLSREGEGASERPPMEPGEGASERLPESVSPQPVGGEPERLSREGEGASERPPMEPGEGASERPPENRPKQWTRGEVLRDPVFYALLPAVLCNGFVLTGVFFHQIFLIEEKGWSEELLGISFVVFAGVRVSASLLTGPWVDRLGSVRLLPTFLIPLWLGLAAVAVGDHPAALIALFVGSGLSIGYGANVVGAMWADVYGVVHLGAIRSLATAVAVFATSLSPFLLGKAFDLGLSVEWVFRALAGYVGGATLLVLAASLILRRRAAGSLAA